MKKMLSLLIIMCITLTGCKTQDTVNTANHNITTNTPEHDMISETPTVKEETNGYLSITVTKTVSEGNFLTETYCYDLQDGSVSKVSEVPYTSQYPLTTYDRAKNYVYYTASDENGNDQLYLYDLSKDEKRQLTNDLYAINYVFVKDKTLLVIGCFKGSHILSPCIFDKENKSLTSLEWDSDFLTWIGEYNPFTDKFLVSGYSDSDDRRILDKDQHKSTTHYIYELDGTKRTKVLEEKNRVIDTFTANKDKIIYVSARDWFSPKKKNFVKIYDFTSKKTEILENVDDLLNAEYIYWTDDGKILYYKKVDEAGYHLCKYDFDKKSSTTLFSVDGEQAINNIQVLNHQN